MKNAKIRDAVNAAITYLGEHPDDRGILGIDSSVPA